jgi:4-hydroxybenzoate polyprenyltransferase
MGTRRSAPVALRDVLLSLRPTQWTKNLVVLAAFFFAFWDRGQALDVSSILLILPAAVVFCLASSGIYVLNDVRDLEADRAHPQKRFRPIAAGRVPVPAALWIAAVLLAVSGLWAWRLSRELAAVIGGYVAIQLAYTFWLKRLALLDIFVIAAGFVLRAIAGAVVLRVQISPWLLLCTFLLALFLALCKRRHEKLFVAEPANASRPSLQHYDSRLLDQLIAIVGAATIVAYSIYTLAPETVAKFGTQKLGFTIPFVVFGLFRYLDLAYRKEQGDRPEKILLTDIPILVNLALYGLCIVVIFLLYG